MYLIGRTLIALLHTEMHLPVAESSSLADGGLCPALSSYAVFVLSLILLRYSLPLHSIPFLGESCCIPFKILTVKDVLHDTFCHSMIFSNFGSIGSIDSKNSNTNQIISYCRGRRIRWYEAQRVPS